jgi:hypothetical protein
MVLVPYKPNNNIGLLCNFTSEAAVLWLLATSLNLSLFVAAQKHAQ